MTGEREKLQNCVNREGSLLLAEMLFVHRGRSYVQINRNNSAYSGSDHTERRVICR